MYFDSFGMKPDGGGEMVGESLLERGLRDNAFGVVVGGFVEFEVDLLHVLGSELCCAQIQIRLFVKLLLSEVDEWVLLRLDDWWHVLELWLVGLNG